MTHLHPHTRRKNMKRISYTAMAALAFVTILSGCTDGPDVTEFATEPPPPGVPLVWDEADWNEVFWQ
jgi:hypothetical protein